MDNGWKSKKDKNGNVKHYKTNNAKKPFGISRELAAEEVQAMRKNGYKARLIKTNRRLDLYAPYESVLPSNQVETLPNKKFSSYEEIEKEFGMSRSDAQGWADTHPDMLEGDLKDDVEQFSSVVKSANPGPATILDVQKMRETLSNAAPRGKEWSDRKTEMYSSNGEVYTTLTNASHTVMLYEQMEGSAPSDEGHIFKVPAVSYPDAESGWMSIEGDNKKELLRMISEAKKAGKGSEPIVYFTTPEHSQETYVGVFSSGTNHNNETNMVGKPLKLLNVTTTHTDVQDVISGDFLAEAIRAVGKMDKSLGIKNSSITFQYKSDFPAKLTSGNREVSTNALIAPRIAEQYQVTDMKRLIMDEISKKS